MTARDGTPLPRGPVSWMAQNRVAANLVMAVFVIGGAITAFRVKQEVFPSFTVDRVSISVPYPGASPEEIEKGVLLAIEDAVQGLDGVKQVTSNAQEGQGSVAVEMLIGVDQGKVLQDVKNEVDRIQSFPEDAERPVVSLAEPRRQVLSVMISGELDQRRLRALAEQARDELLNLEGVTLVEIASARPVEIAVEIPRETLRALGLTLPEVARTIAESSLELPGGAVRTAGGEVLLRMRERRDLAAEFGDIPIVARPDGSRVLLRDVADLRDTFRETDQEATYDGRPAMKVDVFRVGDETPQSVSEAVHAWMDGARARLPDGVDLDVWQDESEIYRDRIDLLLRNAALGLALVLLLLGLFLDARLAFWVSTGIIVSVIGSFLVLPFTGASINMISLFAFIVTLGIVVDDAIIVGENVYEMRQRGMDFTRAAVLGAREIAGPVVFAVLTNIAAFMPLFFVPGGAGNLFRQIPAIVVAVFTISLLESLFVLPAHLAHAQRMTPFWRLLDWPRRGMAKVLGFVTGRLYPPVIQWSIWLRYGTLAIALALLVLAGGAVAGGLVKFSFLPNIDNDVISAQATLPFGAPVEESRRVQRRLLDAAQAAAAELGGDADVRGVYASIGTPLDTGSPAPVQTALSGSHLVGVQVQLVSAELRDFGGSDFARVWREKVGRVAGLESLSFNAEAGSADGAAIDVQLSHRDLATLERAAGRLATAVETYPGVIDVDDGVNRGKPQLDLTLTPAGRALGLTAGDVARQVRAAFFGAEALRQQRGRNEVRVMVRLPEDERETLATVESLVVRTPTGGEIPLVEAAAVQSGYAYTQIRRRDGRRIVAVTADVDETKGKTANEILAEVAGVDLPALTRDVPGLTWSFEGEQKAQRESLEAIAVGSVFALLAIFAMLAIPFRSYLQPLIVMLSIPFGIIGAVLGHVLLGYGLSIISMFGIIALSGVVVNDSMVLIVTANRLRDEGERPEVAVALASIRRFRPIVLTSLTTFFGLAPMIFETSLQARFLIPMAISLGFGILFSTLIILLVVPAIYMVLVDLGRFFRSFAPPEDEVATTPAATPARGDGS